MDSKIINLTKSGKAYALELFEKEKADILFDLEGGCDEEEALHDLHLIDDMIFQMKRVIDKDKSYDDSFTIIEIDNGISVTMIPERVKQADKIIAQGFDNVAEAHTYMEKNNIAFID